MNAVSYAITAVICFFVALIYFFSTTHENDKYLSAGQKIFYSIIAALILPVIILGAAIMLGIGETAHGG